MIKRHAEARILHDAFMRTSADINDAMLRIWDELSGSERERVRTACGRILGELYVEGLRPLEHKHPALIPPDRAADSV